MLNEIHELNGAAHGFCKYLDRNVSVVWLVFDYLTDVDNLRYARASLTAWVQTGRCGILVDREHLPDLCEPGIFCG